MSDNKKLLQAATIVTGVFFILAGTPKAIGLEPAVVKFASWGLPKWFMHFVGCSEWAAGLGLLIKQTRVPAAFATLLIMVGATVTHLSNQDYLAAPIPVVVGIIAAFIFRGQMKLKMNASSAHSTPMIKRAANH